LLASARITTQFREIELTHAADRRDRDEAGAEGFIDDSVRGLAETSERASGALGGAVSLDGTVRGVAFVRTVSLDATARGSAAGEMAGAIGGATTGTVVSGKTWLIGVACGTLSRSMLSALTTVVRGGVAAVVLARAVSAGSGSDRDFAVAFVRLRPVAADPSSRRNSAVPTIATRATAPTPLQTLAAMGARSGFVPHHRHSPRVSR
jgi:hypothetical protein